MCLKALGAISFFKETRLARGFKLSMANLRQRGIRMASWAFICHIQGIFAVVSEAKK